MLNAICTGRRHQSQCECRPGYRGNPFVQCDVPLEPPTKVEPECKQDPDCPSQLACINQRCTNPCATPHVCTPQQTCHVLDTLPLRTMICKCPSDTITDNSGNCVPIKHEVVSGCQSNDECSNTEVCQRGVCIDACRLERCGINAQCRSRDHYAECTCARGYEGNPHVECQLIVHEQPKTPGAECTKNDDCLYDKTCKNERCVNPCAEDSCGSGAYCHVQNREPVCRCPTGFTGDARVGCVPRKYTVYEYFQGQGLRNLFIYLFCISQHQMFPQLVARPILIARLANHVSKNVALIRAIAARMLSALCVITTQYATVNLASLAMHNSVAYKLAANLMTNARLINNA